MNTSSIIAVLAGSLAVAISGAASATPVRATFDGTVSGADFFTAVLGDFPIGTAASFDVTFDDSSFLPTYPLTSFGVEPVSGWLKLGVLEWSLDAGSITTYGFGSAPGNAGQITQYGVQLTGTGPTIASGNASFFGLFMYLTPNLTKFGNTSFMAGFGYPIGDSGTFYSYAKLDGDYSISKITVPEPSTALLMLSTLAMVWRARRARTVGNRPPV